MTKAERKPRKYWVTKWHSNGQYGRFNPGEPTARDIAVLSGSCEVINLMEVISPDPSERIRELEGLVREARDILSPCEQLPLNGPMAIQAREFLAKLREAGIK